MPRLPPVPITAFDIFGIFAAGMMSPWNRRLLEQADDVYLKLPQKSDLVMRSILSLLPALNTFKYAAFWRQMRHWLLFVLLLGLLAGSASALFLWGLEEATSIRNDHHWLIYLLPLGGWLIGWTYQRFGQVAGQGNALLLATYQQPGSKIPIRMAPMVLLGTWLTHLLGGSAGREGTAVQMGGALADQVRHWLKTSHLPQRVVLLCGIAAGFSSVFGTPWAGAVFAVEVMRHKAWPRWAALPVVAASWTAHWICLAWGAQHSHYHLGSLPALNALNMLYGGLAGLAFGAAAWLFIQLGHWQHQLYQKWVPQLRWRAFMGGLLLALIFAFTQNDRYLGLGLPVIAAAFKGQILPYDFILKVLFTTFTLSVGFKGGEVTPLFFIGATLGALLVSILPLPVGLLAGMGFVAVFAGATHCPIACVFMGMELFGLEAAPFLLMGCTLAFLISGKVSIYTSTSNKNNA